MFLVTDTVGMNIIRPLLRCFTSKSEAILHGEVAISQQILRAGYQLRSQLLNHARRHSVTNCTHGDILLPEGYEGIDVHPLEVIFFKTNRRVLPNVVERYTEWKTAM